MALQLVINTKGQRNRVFANTYKFQLLFSNSPNFRHYSILRSQKRRWFCYIGEAAKEECEANSARL